MAPRAQRTPQPDLPPGPGGLYDVHTLAARLGVTTGTLRQYLVHGASWIPAGTMLGNKRVWTQEELVGIDERHPRTPGWAGRREREAREASAAAEQTEQ